MKAKSAAVQGALALVGLVAAYFTWQRPPLQDDGDVVIVGVNRSEVRSLEFEDDNRRVELVPEGDSIWIRQTEKSSPSKTREFRGSEAALKLFERFSPLQGSRALGVLGPEKLQELGLSSSKRALEIVTASGRKRFSLSAASTGTGAPYLKGEEDGRVFLVRGTLVSDLEFAPSRLVDRRLHAFSETDFEALSIRSAGTERKLLKAGDKWMDQAGPGTPDEFATNWHAKLWRLVGVEALGRGEQPAAGEPKVEIRVDYLNGARQMGFVELGKAGDETFARTEHSASWIRLNAGAGQLLDERDQVVGRR